MIDVAERFWTKVEFTESCWLWTASVNSHGYGSFWVSPSLKKAHRFSYEFCVGEIPEGLTLDHLCRVRHCVNPDHLEPVTNEVNVMRGVSPPARKARQTHCIRGHEFTEGNTKRDHRGYRYCRECARLYYQAHKSPELEEAIS